MSSPADRWDIASPPRRGIALLIDLLILVLGVVAASYVIGERTTEVVVRDGQLYARTVATLNAWNVRVVLLMWFSYLMMTERFFGATLGKRLTGIRVVQDDWSPLTVKAAFLRQLTHLVPIIVLTNQPGLGLNVGQLATYGLGSLIALVSEERRRLGDRLAGTLVVRSTSTTTPIVPTVEDRDRVAAAFSEAR
jgi:uncharacterized RDD family membrane protein YckC